MLQEKLNKLEAELGEHRGSMALGYKDPASGDFRKVSSVQLSNTMKTSEDEATRKACWEVQPLLSPSRGPLQDRKASKDSYLWRIELRRADSAIRRMGWCRGRRASSSAPHFVPCALE